MPPNKDERQNELQDKFQGERNADFDARASAAAFRALCQEASQPALKVLYVRNGEPLAEGDTCTPPLPPPMPVPSSTSC